MLLLRRGGGCTLCEECGITALASGSTLCITTGHRLVTCYVTDDTTSESIAAPGLTMDVTVYALK